MAKRSQHFNATHHNIVGHNMLESFGLLVTICCDMLRVVGSSLKMVKFFGQLFRCCMMLYSFGHVRATLLRLSMRTSFIFYFKAPRALSNMSQHIATRWPNVCNMLCPTMLWYVALKCCVRLASPFTTSSNNVVICCVEMLRSFSRGFKSLTIYNDEDFLKYY